LSSDQVEPETGLLPAPRRDRAGQGHAAKTADRRGRPETAPSVIAHANSMMQQLPAAALRVTKQVFNRRYKQMHADGPVQA